MLLAQPNQTVPLERLLAALWGDRPPASARANLQQYVHQLRVVLGGNRLLSQSGGYSIAVGDGLDASHFRSLAAKGRAELDKGAIEQAGRTLRAALDWWRGPAYADFVACDLLAEEASRLEQLRLTAYEGWAEAELALGRHVDLTTELADLAQAHPFRENLRGHLMLALYRSGRQVEALQAFRDIDTLLRRQLGVEPGPALQRLHEAMLRNDEHLQTAVHPLKATPPVAWWLPTPLSDFVGRQQELDTIESHVMACRGRNAAPMIAISGLPGIGKTALAIMATHRLKNAFAAGQLYLDLHGHDEPRDPRQVLHRFLRDMGVAGSALPDDVEECAALYRSLLSQHPRLVLLDNAASVAQIGPLLPPPESAVVVTSRRMLVDLDGACFVTLQPWSRQEALHMLSVTIGAARVAQEAQAAADIVGSCGRLPLAVRIAAGRSLAPGVTLTEVAQSLSESAHRLNALNSEERSVRASLQSGYESLAVAEQRLLRCLSLVTTDDFPAWIATAALDSPAVVGQNLLSRLVQTRFVESLGSDVLGQPRYRLHDLVRPFAVERAQQQDTPVERSRTLRYVADAWLALAEEADSQLHYNGSYRLAVTPSLRPAMTDAHRRDPRQWFAVEISSILNIARESAETAYCWKLAWVCEEFLRIDDRHVEMMTHCKLGLDAASRDNDPGGIVRMSLALAFGSFLEGDLATAETHARYGFAVSEQLDDSWLRAELLGVIALIDEGNGRTDQQRAALLTAVELYQQVGDSSSAGAKLTMLGELATRAFDEEAAIGYYQQGVALLRASGAHRPLAMGLRRLAKSHTDRGEATQAVALYQECLHLLDKLEEPIGELCVHTEIAMAYLLLDAFDAARHHVDQALKLGECVTLPLYLHFARLGHGMLLARTGDPHTALDIISTAVGNMEAHPTLYVTGLLELGRLHHTLGDPVAARTALDQAATTADRLSLPRLAQQARST